MTHHYKKVWTMGDVSGLLRNDLRRLIPYIVMAPLAAIMIAMDVSLGTLIIPMIVAAYATCSLFSDDRGCGWLTFAASAGIGRRRIIASRILALLILSIPVAVIPAICTVDVADGGPHPGGPWDRDIPCRDRLRLHGLLPPSV